jgi:TetR/AcrR family transcriptional regulator, lmrAB and yxaGH operons repressor
MAGHESRRSAPGRTKQRMVDSAVALLRERGAAGVTLESVLAHSGAPRGSVYHHFPGGKSELILAAARRAGNFVAAMIDESITDNDPHAALDRFIQFWKHALTTTDFLAGCPIVALAVDSHQDTPQATELVRDIFTRWHLGLETLLAAHGFPEERARRLATLMVCAIEGAVILCRTHRDTGPLDDLLAEITPLLEAPSAHHTPQPRRANRQRQDV